MKKISFYIFYTVCILSMLFSTKTVLAQSILDLSFGTSGSVRTFINGGKNNNKDDRATSVALQSDGKIVVAGRSENDLYYYAFALARFNADGSLDSSFGTNGTVRNNINGGNGYDDEANSVVIQSDGKIVAAGSSSGASGEIDFALARYNTNGSLDNSFGANGTVRNNINISTGNNKINYAYAAAIQSDGKILLAGYSNNSINDEFALARYNTDGSLDNTFGTSGTIREHISGGDKSGDRANSIALQSDGKIVAAGYSTTSSGPAFAIARFNTNGSFDSTYGTNGSTISHISGGGNSEDIANTVVIQSDGKIVAAGQSMDSSGYKRGCALARYNKDGSLDNTFGTGGTMRNYISGGNSSNDIVCSIVMQADQKIIAAGWSEDAVGNTFAILRYKADGSLDNSFNTNGVFRNHISGGSNYYDGANSVAIQTDGKIVAAGWDEDILLGDAFAVARYTGTPTSVINEGQIIPTEFAISQNFPNPFNPTTTINYYVPKTCLIIIKVYDITGHEVAALVNEEKASGKYSVNFNTGKYASGVYFYRMQAGSFSNTKKMMMLK
jgi:uncharacterized delta-60 repeat protein